MSNQKTAPENVGKVLIKHACGHELKWKIRHPLGSDASRQEREKLEQLLCTECMEERRREKDRRRTEIQNRLYIATRLMAAGFIGQLDFKLLAEQSVSAADCLLAALRDREGQA